MNIIIPTYPPHFLWNKLFIQSFKKFCVDYDNSSIQFIVNKNDLNNFLQIMGSFLDNNIKVKIFEEILQNQKQNHVFYPENIYQKYSFQAIKKMFSVLDSEYEKNLVLDSENVAVNNFFFKDLFANDNNIYFCNWTASDVQNHVVNGCNRLLKSDNTKWFFETSFWIYEKQNFQNVVDFIVEKNNIKKEEFVLFSKNVIFFEKNLYDLWLLNISNKNVQIFDERDCLSSFENSEVLNYLNNKSITTEHIISYISNDRDIDNYIDFVNKRRYNIFRINDYLNDFFINKIINSTNAKILTIFDNKQEIYNYWNNKING